MIEIRIIIGQTDQTLVNVATQVTRTNPLPVEEEMAEYLDGSVGDVIDWQIILQPELKIVRQKLDPLVPGT